MHLAGFWQLAASPGSDAPHIRGMHVAYILGLVLGQLPYAPLIDFHGRRKALLYGIVLCSAASAGCLVVTGVDALIVLCLLQALGGCAGIVVCRVIVNEAFGALAGAQAVALLHISASGMAVLAPPLGAWLIGLAGWRPVFMPFLPMSVLAGVLVMRGMPEYGGYSRWKRRATAEYLRHAWRLLGRRGYILPVLVSAVAQAGLCAFVAGSASVFMDMYHVDGVGYASVLAASTGAMMVYAILNHRVLRSRSPGRVLGFALPVQMCVVSVLLVLGPKSGVLLMAGLLVADMGLLGLVAGNATAMAMAAARDLPGAGSALMGALQTAGVFLAYAVVAWAHDGSAYPMVITMVVATLMASIFWEAASD